MKRQLTVMEATSIIVGAGVGGGVMAVPYLASKAGPLAFLPTVGAAFALNVALNLLLTEILVRDGRDLQIVELMREYAFRGRVGGALAWLLFAVLGLSFVASLAAYVFGAGTVLADLITVDPLWARLFVYAGSAAVVSAGLKSVGRSEKIALMLLLAFCAVIVGGVLTGSGRGAAGSAPGRTGDWRAALALYGTTMYSLNAAFAVPQAVKGLGRDARRSALAVVSGTAINAALVIVVTATAVAAAARTGIAVTEVAVVGIGAAAGPAVAITGSLFVVVAMVTTYWSVSLALATIIDERLHTGDRIAWGIATAPTMALVIVGKFGFLEYLQMAGGIVALIIVFTTVPMYLRSRRKHPGVETLPGMRWIASPVGLTIFLCGMAAMAAGSLIGIATP